MELPTIQRARSHEAVTELLRRWIALGGLRPGDRLPSERDLSERLGVGRTTLRAAIRTLNEEGLLRTRRGRSGGTFVDEASVVAFTAPVARSVIDDVNDNFDFRIALEPLAARLCAERARDEDRWAIRGLCETSPSSMRGWRALDSRFHLLIAEAGGNALVIDAVRASREQFFFWADGLFSGDDWMSTPPAQRDFGGQHHQIADAIVEHDGDLAERRMEEHLRDGRIKFLAAVRRRVDPAERSPATAREGPARGLARAARSRGRG